MLTALQALTASCCLFVGPDPDAAKLAIDNQLRLMQAAMLAGDKEGYLAHVYRGDREFLKEQTYFANDLAKPNKHPEEITLTMGDLTLGDGTAEGKMTWAWHLPGKKHREVSFDARFVEVEGQWLYAGETWQRHEAPGVIVYCDPGLDELAARTVEAFTAVRAKVEAVFELTDADLPKKTQKIKLYGSMRHLQQSICLAYEDGLGGWNEPGESIKLLSNARSSVGSLKALLSHEYGHVATFELGPQSNSMPWWVLEGVAELSSELANNGRSADALIKRWARTGKLAPWDELADFETCKPQYQGHVYQQGHAMLSYISNRFGQTARNHWMRSMSAGKTLDQATQEVLGLPWSRFDEEWRATLPKQGDEDDEADKPKDDTKPNAAPDPKPEPAKKDG